MTPNTGIPIKREIEKALKSLLNRPKAFNNKKTLAELREYRAGQSPLTDFALWNVYKAVETEKGITEAIAILEDTIAGKIKTIAEIKAVITT